MLMMIADVRLAYIIINICYFELVNPLPVLKDRRMRRLFLSTFDVQGKLLFLLLLPNTQSIICCIIVHHKSKIFSLFIAWVSTSIPSSRTAASALHH
jgi:type IV secretory pathway VirB3-like protein